jgi:hypothetical protein
VNSMIGVLFRKFFHPFCNSQKLTGR